MDATALFIYHVYVYVSKYTRIMLLFLAHFCQYLHHGNSPGMFCGILCQPGLSSNPKYETWRIVGKYFFPGFKMRPHCTLYISLWRKNNFNGEMQSNRLASFLQSKQACCAGCRLRPFPMQLHQQAKSTLSVKWPKLLNHFFLCPSFIL